MIEPTMINITMEILDILPIEEIIYSEYAEPGAMGNAGGVMIYIINDDNLICYETNIKINESVYNKAVDILVRNQITSRYNNINNENGIFKFYGGGMGNNVLINKNLSLKIANGYFIYIKNEKEYYIYSSVQGVFDRVAFEIRRHDRHKKFLSHWEYLDKKIDEEKKQKALLYEKLDKELIQGRKYTEKEINEILKKFCTSQDYVSFRRSLIDKGYLYRTNDCKEYWREICQGKTAF